MVNTSIRLGVALATLFNVAVVTATENPLSLDTTGGIANDTDFLGMLEEENDFDHGSSITERKKCPSTRKCTKAKGSCIKSKAFCDGKVVPKGCKGKKCKCCTPDNTTLAPLTCPTCPAPTTCPTTPAASTCPTCPAPPTCPTCPALSTCPTCPAPPTVCAEGLFSIVNTTLCFKRLNDRYIWTEAIQRCRDQGLYLAQPSHDSAVPLRQYLLDHYGDRNNVWVGARKASPNSEVLWQMQEKGMPFVSGIPRNSSLWITHYGPGGQYANDDRWHCVMMVVEVRYLASDPNAVYKQYYCDWTRYPLCQALDPKKYEENQPTRNIKI